MLRVRYTDRKSVFEYRRIKKEDAAATVLKHYQHWSRGQTKEGGMTITKIFSPHSIIAEWQDGDGLWDDSKPVELINVPAFLKMPVGERVASVRPTQKSDG